MKIYSVSELNRSIKNLFEESFSEIWIEGEITNFKPASSGHVYFSLKDNASQMRAVMFRGVASHIRFRPENGLAVRCYGRLTVYEPRGDYQIIIEHMEPQGVGSLQLAFEQLKKKLEVEGLFEASRKKKLPYLPKKIGIVTSPTGAVIRDMIHVLTRRSPNIQILLAPVLVQGAGSAEDIARAICEMNDRDDLDLLIVGRGGGSMEDLWAFNEEVVARAIAGSRLPVISAVGHETDFTIADFVADLRAPTPSAAAELAVPVTEDLMNTIRQYQYRLSVATQQKLENLQLLLHRWEAFFRDPTRRLTENLLRVDHFREQLRACLDHRVELLQAELKSRSTHLEALNPLSILERGYAIAMPLGSRKPLKNSKEVAAGEEVIVRLYQGELKTIVK